ncbi:MAG: stage III sporulation protein AE [Christensenellales bacterium]|jgi:stage III sporulation protein AE
MRKFIIITIILILIFGNYSLVYAEDTVQEQLEDNVDKYTDSIDFSEIEEYAGSLSEEGDEIFVYGYRNLVDDIVKGNFKTGFNEFFKMTLRAVTSNIASLLPIFASIIAIGVLCSVSSNLVSGFMKKSTMEVIYFVCYAIIIILVVTTLTGVSTMVSKTVRNLNIVIDVIFPIMLTLVTSLGGSVTVTVYQGSLAVLSLLITSLLSKIIIPAFLAVIVFSVVGNMSSNVKLDKLASTIKSGAEWLMGISFGLYMIVLAFQGVGGAAFDGISVKAMKFMMSSYVPILGGYLSEGFDVIMASCVLIKNAVGITAIMLIISTILFPVIKILILTLGLKLTASILEPVADKRISDFLYLVSKSTSLLISAVLGIGLILISSVMLLIVTCNGGI